jgi:hypothetical protein
MRLPGPEARAEILSALLANLPEELRGADASRLVAATDGFTGADLKAMVEDGKAIYAYDKANQNKPQPTTEYFLRAITSVQENKQHYAAAEAQLLLQPKSPMGGFMRSFVTSRVFKGGNDDD